ncbi:methionyl-tRNA formyltransferase [Zavarzinia sp. CC-PAN008]|uniref:methionyl-tRNA formyltransferase n=1 Tax=Zavarzinia sp. CC-PAN008 TaxID=3243332 RepID=UPI003F745259
MRLAFMGTPEFSVPVFDALHAAGHEIACVYSQPPRPAGRGRQLRPSAVHARAEALGIPVRTPLRLRDPADQAAFAALDLDVAVVVAYGLILPRAILDAPRLGCVNVHASLLPRWRGAAPIQRAIMAGDAETGVTIMQMDAGLDTGPMLLHEAVPITDATTGGSLHDALAALGATLIVPALAGLADGSLQPQVQPDAGVTYAAKLTTEDERLDWRRPAAELAAQVRALSPRPGAFATLDGERLRVSGAESLDGDGAPGATLDDRLTVACGRGALRLTLVQAPGKRLMDAADFLRGRPVPRGTRLD